jgi:hypothetical protein
VTPRLRALRASEVKVRTTPLTWGCQASVAISTLIGLRTPYPSCFEIRVERSNPRKITTSHRNTPGGLK